MLSEIEIIAEIGVNHNGDVSVAEELIQAASAAGATTVKVQLFSARKLVTGAAPLATYQQANGVKAANQLQMLEDLELSPDEIFHLQDVATSLKLRFLATPFDMESLSFLADELGHSRIKVGSGDITFFQMLFGAASRGMQILLSTGMSSLDEVSAAVQIIRAGLAVNRGLLPSSFIPTAKNILDADLGEGPNDWLMSHLTLLHCTSTYPAPNSELNISALSALGSLNLPLGYSDHSASHLASVLALAYGARVFEKHLTLDKSQAGPDHAASLDPAEFRDYVQTIELANHALGDGLKRAQDSEIATRTVARRGLVASQDLTAGEPIVQSNLECKRPLMGTPSELFYEILGHELSSPVQRGACIEL